MNRVSLELLTLDEARRYGCGTDLATKVTCQKDTKSGRSKPIRSKDMGQRATSNE